MTLAVKDWRGFLIKYPHATHKAGLANQDQPTAVEKKPKKPDNNKATPSPSSPSPSIVSKQGNIRAIKNNTMLRYLKAFVTRVAVNIL